eukprot:16293-Eustigmatos_ZCMA.PRE.1
MSSMRVPRGACVRMSAGQDDLVTRTRFLGSLMTAGEARYVLLLSLDDAWTSHHDCGLAKTFRMG